MNVSQHRFKDHSFNVDMKKYFLEIITVILTSCLLLENSIAQNLLTTEGANITYPIKPTITYLKDYTAPTHYIDKIDLLIELGEEKTIVTAKSYIRANPNAKKIVQLVLNGKEQVLHYIKINDRQLTEAQYELNPETLTLKNVPDNFTLEIQTEIYPHKNVSLEGLYKSNGLFCTHCEPDSFQKITYFLDRPDVLARFTTTIVANKKQYPILLSNGNLIANGELSNGKHWVKWEDPFKKPCYLFALVAGDLDYLEDYFITKSDRKIILRIFCEKGYRDQCKFAMTSLKKAMKWDEENYGRECDLDLYMIVTVSDFTAGATESKGLNIFNSKYIFAKPELVTDRDYENIDCVVAHEYFHNWTGNRITCRDWFQLSLKEGLTVFRDQSFMEDVASHAVKRINDVIYLRNFQLPVDQGPLAHPVRPDSYQEIANFYTTTVYEKGAEVFRMLKTILGKGNFHRGMDLYFSQFDGQAVTSDDFIKVMEDVSGINLSQFKLWYSQAGTPKLHVTSKYDPIQKQYTLTVKQMQDKSKKLPMHIPLKIALLAKDGAEIPLRLLSQELIDEKTPIFQLMAERQICPKISMGMPFNAALLASDDLELSNQYLVQQESPTSMILDITKPEQSFVFDQVAEKPIPSLLRDFSAPVKLIYDYDDKDLVFLMENDQDSFARFEAGQLYITRILFQLIEKQRANEKLELPEDFVLAFKQVLLDNHADKALIAKMINLPSEIYLGSLMAQVDVEGIHEAREFVRKKLAEKLRADFENGYQSNQIYGEYKFQVEDAAKRSLKNACLDYLAVLEDEDICKLITLQFKNANNMTDQYAALGILGNTPCVERKKALDSFYEQWKQEPLVIDKWLSIWATSFLPGTLEDIKALLTHPGFNIKNPNRVYALLLVFAEGNPTVFHTKSGAGYRLLADQILILDKINPKVAARLTEPFAKWNRFDQDRQKLMKEQLERILSEPRLSKNVYEIVSKSLKAS